MNSPALALRLEKSTFNIVVKKARVDDVDRFWENPVFRKRYITKGLSMVFNLNNPATPHLKQTMLDALDDERQQRVICDRLVRMTPQEMYPELWKEAMEEVERRANRSKPKEVKQDHDGLYKCRHCGSMRTTYTLIQTRSADEPSSAFILCANCKKRWKMSA